MNKGVTVNNQLTLTNGGLDLNGNQINVTNASTSSITRTSGYIISEKQPHLIVKLNGLQAILQAPLFSHLLNPLQNTFL